MNPLAGVEHTREQLLDVLWTLVLDIAARTGHDPAVVALTHGLVPAARVMTTNRTTARP